MSDEANVATSAVPVEPRLEIEDVRSMLGERDIQLQLLSTALARAQQRIRELEAQLKKQSG